MRNESCRDSIDKAFLAFSSLFQSDPPLAHGGGDYTLFFKGLVLLVGPTVFVLIVWVREIPEV